MAIVTGLGTTWNLPNYSGELFTADATVTPLLSMTGGLTGGRMTDNFEFVTSQLYDFPAAAQPDISEQASATAPTAAQMTRAQETNVVQIHQERINLTYAKMSNSGRLSGINTAMQSANPPSERNWQIEKKLQKIARDVEYSFINGVYQKAGNASTSNRTRGLIPLTKGTGGTTIDAGGYVLTMDMLQALYLAMADSGAEFANPVMFLPAKLKQKVTNIYSEVNGFGLPQTRNVGGIDITSILMDFGQLGIVWNRFMPNDSILVADVAYVEPVFQEVPTKGVLFEEELAKTGASDDIQLYGQIGLAHGPAFLHGSITNIGDEVPEEE